MTAKGRLNVDLREQLQYPGDSRRRSLNPGAAGQCPNRLTSSAVHFICFSDVQGGSNLNIPAGQNAISRQPVLDFLRLNFLIYTHRS